MGSSSFEGDSSIVTESAVNIAGNFIQKGLELFGLSLATRDPSNVINDVSLIGTIVSLVQSALPCLERILVKRWHKDSEGVDRASTEETEGLNTTGVSPSPSNAFTLQPLLIVQKALYCLEISVEKTGYLSAFRESEGLQPISALIELFSQCGFDTYEEEDGDSPIDLYAKHVLAGALSVLHQSILKSRHSFLLQVNNTTDTGIRIVYQPFFEVVCSKVFGLPFKNLEIHWVKLIYILKEVIDQDPPFLSHFLRSTMAQVPSCFYVWLYESESDSLPSFSSFPFLLSFLLCECVPSSILIPTSPTSSYTPYIP